MLPAPGGKVTFTVWLAGGHGSWSLIGKISQVDPPLGMSILQGRREACQSVSDASATIGLLSTVAMLMICETPVPPTSSAFSTVIPSPVPGGIPAAAEIVATAVDWTGIWETGIGVKVMTR